MKFEEVSHEMIVLMLQHVSSRWLSSAVAVSMGEAAKPLLLSKQVVMSFCVAGVALPDNFTCLQTRPKSFCVAGAILLRRFQKVICSCRGRRSTWQAQRLAGAAH